MGACNIIELYAIRDVLLVSLSVTFPIITDLGRLNEIVIREIDYWVRLTPSFV